MTLKQGSYSFVDANQTCRIGQTITGVTGTATYSNGKHTITLTKKPEFTGNERPTACTTDKPYNLKVVSFNLEHFNKNSTEYDFQIKCKKVSLVLQALQADVYALVEVEGVAGLEALCTMLNEALGTQKYKTRYLKDPDVLVVGDLNAYTAEDPIRTLQDGGLINLLTLHAPNEYSYAFFINNSYTTGYLDHSLATPSLEAQTAIARPFRINADEPARLDMDKTGLQKDNMYRCSDHNPIVTFLNLGDNTTGIEDHGVASSHPTIRLSGNPRSGHLTLTSNTEFALYRAEIIAISGQVVATFTTAGHSSNSLQLPIKGLARGFYMVRAYNVQGLCATSKVVLP